MKKIERVVREVSDLRRFYLRIVPYRRALQAMGEGHGAPVAGAAAPPRPRSPVSQTGRSAPPAASSG